jgi:hypothetical protein
MTAQPKLPSPTERMTKSERTELGQLIRKRERVMKAATDERGAVLIAEFEKQSATIYAFDDDAVWKQATELAKKAADEANEQIKVRCKELGIPEEFAPGCAFGWYGRGQNSVAGRRAELRRVARSRIEALVRQTKTKIEQLSLAAQTEVVANGLQSDAARAFLEKMPTLEALMPAVDVTEVQNLLTEKEGAR